MTAGIYATGLSKQPPVLALDFDGVICASSGESSVSSIFATKGFWAIPTNEDSAALGELIRKIVDAVRPIVETGFENMLIVRYVYESYDASNTSFQENTTQYILSNWGPTLRDELIAKYGSSKEELVTIFGAARDKMISDNLTYWVGLNAIYPGAQEAMKSLPAVGDDDECEFNEIAEEDMLSTFGDIECGKFDVISREVMYQRLFIVTTKQGRFVREILESNGIYLINTEGASNSKRWPHGYSSSLAASSNLFDLDNAYGSKINVLLELTKRLEAARLTPAAAAEAKEAAVECMMDAVGCDDTVEGIEDVPTTIHFVEDRYETLQGVIQYNADHANELGHVKLYLAEWGYNTPRYELIHACSCTTLYNTVQHYTTTIPHYTTLYHTVPHYTTLYHSIPYTLYPNTLTMGQEKRME